MKEILEKGEKIKISGFGNFIVREKRLRKGRNPKTGEELAISAIGGYLFLRFPI
jgi:integration host factor subunit alpha